MTCSFKWRFHEFGIFEQLLLLKAFVDILKINIIKLSGAFFFLNSIFESLNLVGFWLFNNRKNKWLWYLNMRLGYNWVLWFCWTLCSLALWSTFGHCWFWSDNFLFVSACFLFYHELELLVCDVLVLLQGHVFLFLHIGGLWNVWEALKVPRVGMFSILSNTCGVDLFHIGCSIPKPQRSCYILRQNLSSTCCHLLIFNLHSLYASRSWSSIWSRCSNSTHLVCAIQVNLLCNSTCIVFFIIHLSFRISKLDWLPFILLMIYWVFIIGHFIKQSLLTQLILVDLLF